MTTCASPLQPNEHYDSVSRATHWLMFLLFAWIYCSAITHYLASDSTLDKWLWPFHKPVGLLLLILLILLVLRAGWSLLSRHRRPPSISRIAATGHGMLYALMFLIPLIGMIRQYGSGRAFSAFGVPVMDGFEGEKIQWMVDLGSNFHSLLGWTMLVLILGHVAAVIVHYWQGDAQVLQRMTRGGRKH